MILATNVQYENNAAWAAAVLFQEWTDAAAVRTLLTPIPEVAEYQAGEFCRRELPYLLALIEQIDMPLSHNVVDGVMKFPAGEVAAVSLGVGHQHMGFIGVVQGQHFL